MIKLLLLSNILAGSAALEAVFSVTPDTVGSISSLDMQIMFDESLGRGGIISVQVPEDGIADSARSTLNAGVTFLTDQTSVVCT